MLLGCSIVFGSSLIRNLVVKRYVHQAHQTCLRYKPKYIWPFGLATIRLVYLFKNTHFRHWIFWSCDLNLAVWIPPRLSNRPSTWCLFGELHGTFSLKITLVVLRTTIRSTFWHELFPTEISFLPANTNTFFEHIKMFLMYVWKK